METLVPNFHLELVKDKETPLTKLSGRSLTQEAAEVLHGLLDRSPTEQFCVLYISSDGHIMGSEKIAMGDLENVAVSMKNLFRGALVACAPRIILSHNHPQGDPTASQPDWLMTDIAVMCSQLVGIQILDHIIVSPNGTHYSCWDHKEELVNLMKQQVIKEKLKDMFQAVVPNAKGPFGFDLDAFKKGLGKGLF